MGLQRVHERVRDGFARVHESSREFARVRESSREFARVRESSREFARVRESSQEFARVREGYADGFTTDIRRIRGLTQIREWIHSGFTRVLTQYSQLTAVNPSMAFDKSLMHTAAYSALTNKRFNPDATDLKLEATRDARLPDRSTGPAASATVYRVLYVCSLVYVVRRRRYLLTFGWFP